MNHLHTAKVIATMWPAIDKETVLSKIINQIDTFKISVSNSDEDVTRKYVHMVLKLDNSKSILLDIQWPDVRTRNKEELVVKKWQKFRLISTESFKNEAKTIYIDYAHVDDLRVGAHLHIDHGEVVIEVVENDKDKGVYGKIVQWGSIRINRVVEFTHYIPQLPFLSESDKKHILWWVEQKISLISLWGIKDATDLVHLRDYLREIGGWHLKILPRIDTKEAIEHFSEIVQSADGVIVDPIKGELLLGDAFTETKHDMIATCNRFGKPMLMHVELDVAQKPAAIKANQRIIQDHVHAWVDVFILNHETAISEYPIEMITLLHDTINDTPTNTDLPIIPLQDLPLTKDNTITDYIIYNAYRASKELNIKAIICPTESGYTAARLSTLKPHVPIISFTKNDDAFRYLNLLRWVKGYKIAPTFGYENIKQIVKEIIRILFKGNISLDDKILIVHSSLEQNIPHMINGIEIYKFKDI